MKNIDLSYKYEMQENPDITISNEIYNLKILGTENNQINITISADVQNDYNPENIKDIIQNKIDEEKKSLETNLSYVKELKNVKITIELPRSSKLNISNENGALKISNFENCIYINNENGSIKMNNILGKTKIINENGSIKLEFIEGEVLLETENGSVKMKQCSAQISLENENGSISISDCFGKLQAVSENGMIKILQSNFDNVKITNSNGSIYYEFAEVEKGNFYFINENGKIQLIIPSYIEYSLTAKNKLGKISVGLDGDYNIERENGYKVLKMNKASGKVTVFAENNIGSISLSKSLRKETTLKFEFINDILDDTDFSNLGDIQEMITKTLGNVKRSINNLEIPDIGKLKKNIITKLKTIMPEDENLEKFETEIDETFQTFENEDNEEENESSSHLKILQMLEAGKITADEANKLLEALGEK